MTHNCWHNCELTEALQSLAPAYGDEAHTKVAERMVEDMEAQFTPGPWKEHEGYIVGPDFETICDPRCLPPTGENLYTMDANTRLIAAAPDLLAALEALVKDATECEMHGEPSQVDGIQWDDVLAARAAIAKVKGGAK